MAISDLPEGDLSAAASVPAEGSNEAKPRRVSVTKLAAVLHPLVQPEVVPDPAGLHVGVSEGFLESRAGSVSGQDLVVMLHPMADAVSAPPPPPPEAALTFAAPDTATAGVSFDATITNTGGTASAAWSLNVPSGWTVTPSSGVAISAGATVTVAIVPTAGSQDLVLTSATPVTGNPQSVVVSGAPVLPTTATLSGSSSATTDVAHTSRVTLDAAADQTYTITWTRSNSGTGSATSTITAGNTYVEATDTWGAAGSGRTVDFTISPSLTRAGRPLSVTVSDAVPGGTPGNFTLTSSASGTLPFALGLAFRQGDIPAGSDVAFSGATAKASILSTWPDGSARIALAAGTYTSAGSAVTVTPSAGSNAAGTALTGASVQSAMGANTAVIDCGSYGTATFSGSDFASPFKTHAATSAFGEFIYRKAVGSDAHLVAWLAVRVWAGGAVEVLPWIENGYFNVASPTSKSATFSFTLGGTSRFSAAIDLPARCRTPLVSGSTLSHWLGTDPGVTPTHDTVYLQQTALVPAYQPVTPDASLFTSLPSTYTPLQQGLYRTTMSDTGYHPSIGLLPQWDVLHLLTPTAQTFGAVVRQAYSAGRYASHYRDESTNRPIRLTSHPTATISTAAAASGTAAPVYDTGHHPSMGYLAYLLTGRFYFMEEVQFLATYNYLRQQSNVTTIRQQDKGLFLSASGDCTVRGAAWCNRTLAQAAIVSPDGDAVGTDLKTSLEENIAWNHARYVAQANNQFGLVEPYSSSYGSANGHQIEAPWQQDFYAAAFGFMLAAQPSISSTALTKLSAFFAWKAQWIVGRLGMASASNYLYADAAQYNLEVCATGADFGTGAGPWPASWATIYGWNFVTSNTTDPGSLRGGNFPGAASYWGNLYPAIAYAVRHNVPGAQAAYNALTGASNWLTQYADFANAPEWAVQPTYKAAAPSWVGSVGQWTAIPSSTLSTTSGVPWSGTNPGGSSNYAAHFNAWSGGFVAEQGVWAQGAFYPGKYLCAWGAGHVDYAGNEMYAFGPLDGESPTWRRLFNPTIPAAQDVGRTAGGYPVARHSYDTLQYMPEVNKMLAIGAAGYYVLGYVIGQADVLDFSVNAQSANPWSTADTSYPAFDGGGYGSINLLSARDPATGAIWALGQGNAQRIGKYTSAAGWSSWYIDNAPGATNSKAAIGLGLFTFVNNSGAVVAINVAGASPGALYTPTVTGSGPSGQGVCMEWDAVNGRFVAWRDGGGKTLYFLTPGANPAAGGDAWAWTSTTPAGGDTPAANGITNGQFGRFRLVQSGTARLAVLNTGHNQPVLAYRLS